MYYHNPNRLENDYIHPSIKIDFSNDFYKIIALENIKKNTIVLKEIPKYSLFGEKKYDKIIDLLIIMLQNKEDPNILKLYPRTNIKILNTKENPYIFDLIKYINDSKCTNKDKRFLLKFDKDILYLHYYKILFNAFDMYDSASILINGAMMNHSIDPNIKFYPINNVMYFETIKNIKKGEELTYTYLRNVNCKTDKEIKEYLLNHYNFISL